MAVAFASIRSFHFRQLVAEHNPRGRVALAVLRVFWRAATKIDEQHTASHKPLKRQ